jgi:hypothetical protein
MGYTPSPATPGALGCSYTWARLQQQKLGPAAAAAAVTQVGGGAQLLCGLSCCHCIPDRPCLVLRPGWAFAVQHSSAEHHLFE